MTLQLPTPRRIGALTVALEPALWEALELVALRESSSIEGLADALLERLAEHHRRYEDVHDLPQALTSAMRVLASSYYRWALEVQEPVWMDGASRMNCVRD